MTERTEDAVIVRTIIAMAHALDARVVAEGIETEAQISVLRRARCDIGQGYVIARPAPADRLAGLLAEPVSSVVRPDAVAARTLLLVDDEPNIASSLKRLLRNDGYRILTAESAALGFELLATHEVGVVISDQRMPEMCGTEFLARVKDMYPGTVRLVLSGFTDLESVTGAINNGAIFKFLTKPWEDEAIRATVREAFDRHELLRENEHLGAEAREANLKLSEANAKLGRRVAQKTEVLERQLAILRVSQEALDQLPLGVIGVAIGTALLPMLTRQLRSDDKGIANHTQNRAIETGLFLAVPAAVALIVMPQVILSVLFERGAFDAATTQASASALMAFAAGIPAYVLVKVLAPGFFAREDTKTPVKIGVTAAGVHLVLNLLLMGPLLHVGLAIAAAIAAWFNAIALAVILVGRKQLQLDAALLATILRILLSAVVMGINLHVSKINIPFADLSTLFQIIALLGLVIIGIFSYFGIALVSGALTAKSFATFRHPRQ